MVSDGGIWHSFTFVGGGNISTIGGIVRTVTQIANHLAQQGHEVRYLAQLQPNSKPFYDLHEDVILEPIKYPYSSTQIPAFSKRLAQLQTDVLVVALSGKITLNVMKAAQGLPFPIVRSEHGNPKSLLKEVWKGDEEARAVTFELADYSHLLYEEFANDPDLGDAIKNSMQYIASPIELEVIKADPSKPSNNGKMKIVYSGRIETFEKNSGLLLDSFLQLADEFSDWECHFFGDGALRQELEEVSNIHPNGNQVFFHGSVREEILFKHLSSAHLFVMPSDTEGCPIALGEALAHGLPAIGFADCEGVNKMIKHQENGLLAGFSLVQSDLSGYAGLGEVNAFTLETKNQHKQEPFEGYPIDGSSTNEVRSYLLEDSMRALMSSSELRGKYGKKSPETVLHYERKKILNQWSEFLLGIARKNSNIYEWRKLRNDTYPELLQTPRKINQAIKQFSPNTESKYFWNLLKLSTLYRRNNI